MAKNIPLPHRQRRLNILLFLLLLGVALFAWSNSMRLGNDAQRAGNYRLARMWYSIAAHTGDANAQNNLGGFYAQGLGGPRNDVQAAQWFERAAVAGVDAAKFNLSNFYEEGRGVAKDIRKTVQLLEDLANRRDPVAAFNLGHIHATGRADLPRDMKKAVYWYGQSAQAGYASAQYNLASIYLQGHPDVPQDFALARQWMVRAAQKDHRKAQLDYGVMRLAGVGVEQDRADGTAWVQRAAQDPAMRDLLQQKFARGCSAAPRPLGDDACAVLAGLVPPGK